MQTAGIAHFTRYSRGQESDAFEKLRHIGHIAADHHDRHCLADGTTDTQHHRSGDTALGSRYRNLEHRFIPSSAQSKAGLFILPGNRLQCRFGHADDRGKHHNRKYNDRREQANTIRQIEGLPNKGNQYNHTHQTIDHGRNAGQQIHCGAKNLICGLGGHFPQKNGKQQSHRYADHNGAEGTIDGCENNRQNTELILSRFPNRTGQERNQSDLLNGGQTGDNQVNRDHHHESNSRQTADGEESPHNPLHRFPDGMNCRCNQVFVFHRFSLEVGMRNGLNPSRITSFVYLPNQCTTGTAPASRTNSSASAEEAQSRNA